MTIQEIVAERQIREIVHFTTNMGLTGILYQKCLKARNLLKEDEALEHIVTINTPKVFDPEWKSYVNLSITNINLSLFGPSQNWHSEAKWRILAFDPVILSHPGVQFVTTNNAYSWHLERGGGPAGLEKLFATSVKGVYGKPIARQIAMPRNFPTDPQAEVLYPESVHTDFLRRIVVPSQQDAETVASKISALQHRPIPIIVDPSMFR